MIKIYLLQKSTKATKKESRTHVQAAIVAAVSQVSSNFQAFIGAISNAWQQVFVTRKLVALDVDDAEMYAAMKHERLYLEKMERSCSDMLEANDVRREALQRRLRDLHREAS